ncbi:MAG: hypothetical protein BroJett011_34640 [Chloroflexota bacterium]|nr:MAG: hypothetical protein BroJett011_34640 [Chloroflexota bacterium]
MLYLKQKKSLSKNLENQSNPPNNSPDCVKTILTSDMGRVYNESTQMEVDPWDILPELLGNN